MGNALASFRGEEIVPLDISNITGDPSACGMPDVYGNVGYFNRLCVGTTPIGGAPKLLFTGTSQANNNTPFGTANTWFDVPFAFGSSPITIPVGGNWFIWAEVNVQNTGAAAINIQHRLAAADLSTFLVQSIFTVPAGAYASDTLLIALSTFSGAQFKTQLNVTASTGNVIGNTFNNPLGAMLLALQVGP